jgi:predicted secreted Zn-dependent protease
MEWEIRDWKLLEQTCKDLGIDYIKDTRLSLYGSTRHNVEAQISLPGWKYNVGFTTDGKVLYDHYGSASDSFNRFTELKNEYTLRSAEQVAKRTGKRTWRKTDKNRPGWKFVEVYC